MRYKLTFALGFATGYVMGARAGTQRYEQLENAWRRFVDTPAVQQAAGVIGAQAGQVIGQAKNLVGDKVSSAVGGHRHGAQADGSAPGAGAATSDAGSPYPTSDFGGHA